MTCVFSKLRLLVSLPLILFPLFLHAAAMPDVPGRMGSVTECGTLNGDDPCVSVAKFRGNKRAAVSLTYDDGLKEHIDLVAPELEKRGFRGSFWIIGNRIGVKDPKHGDRMTFDDLRELHRRGHEVGSHTWSHPKLVRLSTPDSVRMEMERVDSAFLVNGLPKPMTMAYPYNGKNAEVTRIVEEGRIGSRMFQVGHGQQNNKSTIQKMTDWMYHLIETCDWGVTMTHAIRHGYDQWYHPEELWQFYDTLKSHEKDIWVGTFAQCCAYQKEREAVQLDVVEDGKDLRVAFSMPLDGAIFHEPLTLILSSRPKSVRQDGHKLKLYRSADGAWCVDAVPLQPLTIRLVAKGKQ